MLQILLLLFLAPTAKRPADGPVRIEPSVADQHLLKRADPEVPEIARLARIEGTVALDIVVGRDGDVVSEKLLSGPPLLQTACIDAVKKRKYKAFLDDQGHAIPIVTKVECVFSGPRQSDSEQRALQAYYPANQKCEELVHAKDGAAAERQCAAALALADQLPADRLIERSTSRTFLAHALVEENRTSEAIPLYEKAIEIYTGVEHSDRDADFASENANLARAYALTGQLDQADTFYGNSTKIFEAAIVDLPDMKDNYSARLKRTLLEHAAVKRARGDADGAKALEEKAGGLP